MQISSDDQDNKNIEIYRKIPDNSFEERAFGCIAGAFVGDACGSKNEFTTVIQGDKFMDDCMKMPGGGPWRLYSGQITDDSELAMCMMEGIIESIFFDQNDKIVSRGSI